MVTEVNSAWPVWPELGSWGMDREMDVHLPRPPSGVEARASAV